MSIQKKSLISTLKTARKANVAAEHKGEKQVSAIRIGSMKTLKAMDGKSLKTLKSANNTSFRVV
jgi:hypothetical protein